MFSKTVLRPMSLKSWKTTPIVRRKYGTCDVRQHADVAAVDEDLPGGRRLLAEEQLQERRLAGARGARQEDELARLDRARDVDQRVAEARRTPWRREKSWITRRLAERPRQRLPHGGRIGAAAGLLHDLPDEPAEGLGLAATGRARPATGWPATISATAASSAPESRRLAEPLRLDDRLGVRRASRASRPGPPWPRRPRSRRASSSARRPASRSGETGKDRASSGETFRSFIQRRTSPVTQFAASLGGARRGRRSVRSSRRARARRHERLGVPGARRRTARRTGARRARGSSGMPSAASAIHASSTAEQPQVRLREVAVVVRLFLAAHRRPSGRPRSSQRRVSSTIRLAARDDLRLPLDLVLDRLRDEADRVEVLDLDARAERRGLATRESRRSRRSAGCPSPCRRRRRPCSAAGAAAPSGTPRPPRASAGPARSTISTSGTPARFQSTSETSVGHVGVGRVVERLAGVLLEVDAHEPDDFSPRGRVDRRSTPPVENGRSYWRDLVALGQVRVEVVLAGEPRLAVDLGADGRSRGAAPSVTAWRFRTGSVPGKPRQTGQVAELAGAPTVTGQAQKILERVWSWAWTSSPMTGKTRDL